MSSTRRGAGHSRRPSGVSEDSTRGPKAIIGDRGGKVAECLIRHGHKLPHPVWELELHMDSRSKDVDRTAIRIEPWVDDVLVVAGEPHRAQYVHAPEEVHSAREIHAVK